MAKKITVNEKLKRKISSIVSDKLCLTDVAEFEECERCELFDTSPESWSEREIAIHEYTMRKESEITEAIFDLLKNGNAR